MGMVITDTVRNCVVCGFVKGLNEFPCCGGPKGNRGIYRSHTCIDCHNAYKRAWRKLQPFSEYQKMREKNLALYGTSYSPQQHLYNNTRGANRRKRMRLKAILLYGGKCECCGENGSKKLTFDHIQGNGRHDVINIDYSKAIKIGYPNGKYRLLCWNCNASYGFLGYCPHLETKPEKALSRNSLYNRKLKYEMVLAYGGKCAICGEDHLEFMTIDHVNGGGCRIRRKEGGYSGTGLHSYLRKMDYPKDDYRLLCFNCNGSIGLRKRKEVLT